MRKLKEGGRYRSEEIGKDENEKGTRRHGKKEEGNSETEVLGNRE